MKRISAWTVLVAVCWMSGNAHANPAERLAEILTWDMISVDGEISSKTIASFQGCILRLTLDKLEACSQGASVGRTEKHIDVRVLKTGAGDFYRSKPAGTFSGMPGAGLVYSYRWAYNQRLRIVYETSSRIFDQEFNKHRRDVAARLESLSNRYREEIDPRSYAQSRETTFYCSGTEVTQPLPPSSVMFFLNPEEAEEFTVLLEEYALTCKAEMSG